MRAAVRAEPVGARLEVRLKDGFEHELEGRLDHAVGHGRHPEIAELAALLRDHTRRTGTGRNSPDFSESRIWPKITPAPVRFSISATVA